MHTSHLVLGTVQLGMPYGIANKTGQPNQKMATEIIRVAWEGGIREFDTAQEYGKSEEVLGEVFRELGIAKKARAVSKLSKAIDPDNRGEVVDAVQASLKRLGVPRLHALLLHREDWGAEKIRGLRAVVDQGLVDHVGISVYTPNRALQAIATDGVAILQIPSNILDRRFERAGVLKRAREKGVELYVRSVFLQGLLLMKPNDLPSRMDFALPVMQRVEQLAHTFGVTQHVLALQYVKTVFPDAHIIFGAETPAQVYENLAIGDVNVSEKLVERVQEAFSATHEKLIDPRTWPYGSL